MKIHTKSVIVQLQNLMKSSNIKEAYLLGDQRKYFIPCPCCGVMIDWHWTITKGDITGGITWKLDENGKVISNSVGYICQECGGFFDDKNKNELLNFKVNGNQLPNQVNQVIIRITFLRCMHQSECTVGNIM